MDFRAEQNKAQSKRNVFAAKRFDYGLRLALRPPHDANLLLDLFGKYIYQE
jgi:hypothetical protein